MTTLNLSKQYNIATPTQLDAFSVFNFMLG